MFAEALAALARRLDPDSPHPVAVAFSGGGDSLAALIVTLEWVRALGRPVVALTVDHGLQTASADWTACAGRNARRLGAQTQALSWKGTRPETGLPAAARLARHQALAAAARQLGASVIVTGHTADDAGENAVLGQGPLFEWSPSPVWPEGRDIFLLRPLLSLRREPLRQALRERGEAWIDDPANDNPASPRVRARRSNPPPATPPLRTDTGLSAATRTENAAFRLDRARILRAPADEARRVLGAALVCAGGGQTPPRTDRLNALLERLGQAGPVVATLCGAKLLADTDVLIARNAGEAARGGLTPLHLTVDKPVVWDGRYEIEARESGLTVAALRGHAARLSSAERAGLARLPAEVRAGLPVLLGGPSPTCPILAVDTVPVRLRALAASRFWAACGATAQENAAFGPRHGATATSVLC